MGIFKHGTNAEMRAASEKQAVHPGRKSLLASTRRIVLTNARAERQTGKRFTGAVFDGRERHPWDRGRQEMRGFQKRLGNSGTAVESRERRTSRHGLVRTSHHDRLVPRLCSWGGGYSALPYDKIKKYHFSVAKLQELTGLAFGAA